MLPGIRVKNTMDRFIKLCRIEDSEALQHMLKRDHNSFILLTVIANRARRAKEQHPVSGLKQGQCLIGDYKNYGMSEQQYRTAKKNLEKWKIATFKATNKGTVAKLCNSGVYDINAEQGNGLGDKYLTGSQRLRRMKEGEEGKNYTSTGARSAGLIEGWYECFKDSHSSCGDVSKMAFENLLRGFPDADVFEALEKFMLDMAGVPGRIVPNRELKKYLNFSQNKNGAPDPVGDGVWKPNRAKYDF